MEYLITKGVPQRTGHEVVGQLVSLCESRRCRLADLSPDDFAAASPAIGEDVRDCAGRRERGEGVPLVWLDGAGGGGAAVIDLEGAARRTGTDRPERFCPRQDLRSAEGSPQSDSVETGNRGSRLLVQVLIVLLFSSPRGEAFGYKDGWLTESEYLYTGEGQSGDMEMTREAIWQFRNTRREAKSFIFLKKRDPGLYEYLGRFRCDGHEVRRGADVAGQERSILRVSSRGFVIRRQAGSRQEASKCVSP